MINILIIQKDYYSIITTTPTIKFRLWATHYYNGMGKPRTILTENKLLILDLSGMGIELKPYKTLHFR